MSIPSWAVPGRKVVCVKESPGIIDGRIYTIDFVAPEPDPFGDWGLALVEARSPVGLGGLFKGYRFRPLVSTKTEAEDVATFKRLVTDMDPITRVDFVRELLDQ